MITYSINKLNPDELESTAQNMVYADKWKTEHGYNTNDMHLGLLGETAYGLYTNQKVNKTVYKGGDGGNDFIADGCKVNVKTRRIKDNWFELPDLILDRKNINKSDKYVLALYSRASNDITVIGEISNDSFTDAMVKFQQGGPEDYMVHISDLDKLYETTIQDLEEKYNKKCK